MTTPRDLDFYFDAELDDSTQEWAGNAIGIAAEKFGAELDFTEASVEMLEHVLGQFHASLDEVQPDPESFQMVVSFFGSYLGEVYRRAHGGRWFLFRMGGEGVIGFRPTAGPDVWPWWMVSLRIQCGEELDVRESYRTIGRAPVRVELPPGILIAPGGAGAGSEVLCSGCLKTVGSEAAVVAPSFAHGGVLGVYRCAGCAPAAFDEAREALDECGAYGSAHLFQWLLRWGIEPADLRPYTSGREATEAGMAALDAIASGELRVPL
ncbi:MAG TPA: hypothetical protein VNO33_18400 [Kofleriaceae bacterium]|nr:hypothetical protein [Kofleriaceae bacterium]